MTLLVSVGNNAVDVQSVDTAVLRDSVWLGEPAV